MASYNFNTTAQKNMHTCVCEAFGKNACFIAVKCFNVSANFFCCI